MNPNSSKVPVEIAKALAKKLKMSRSFQQNGAYYLEEQLLRPMIMNILNKQGDERDALRQSYDETWLGARRNAKDLYDAHARGDDVTKDPDLGQFIQFKNDGTFNLNGTWGNMLYRGLMNAGLLNREDLENENYFPSQVQRNRLQRSYPFFFEGQQNENYVEDNYNEDLYEAFKLNPNTML